MKRIIKLSMAIFIYALLLLILDFILGIGIKDQWDDLMKWSRK
jgi:hypothetical protein